MLPVFGEIEPVASMPDFLGIVEDRVEENEIQVCVVVDVHVGPNCEAFADHTRSTAVNCGFDDIMKLGVRVHNAGVDERVRYKAVNCGGEDDVRPYVTYDV